jgi:hypothetical protein
MLLLLLLLLLTFRASSFAFSSGVECVDWTGGQIKNNDSSDDVKNVDLTQVHYLSGPITVEGAQPGDLLKVEFLNLGPLDDDEWVSRFAAEFKNCGYYFILPNERHILLSSE